jgi:hypothetical protein
MLFASPPYCLIQWSPQLNYRILRGIFMKSKFLVAFAATLALTACTTTNPYTGQSQLSNTAGGALIGTGGGAQALAR